MSRRTQRIAGLLLLLVAGVTLAFALTEMTSRIQNRTDVEQPPRWATRRIADDSFAYRSKEVTLSPDRAEDGAPVVLVRWGDAEHRLSVTGREDPRLPELLRHDDWLRVFELMEVPGGVAVEPAPFGPDMAADTGAAAAERDTKLIVVTRAPAPGYDPETWGRVRQKDWLYTFVEFIPDGSLAHSTIARSDLPPRSWQEVSALQITPGVQRSAALQVTKSMMHPGKAPEQDSFHSLGWTWTAAGLAVMGIVIGSMFLGASFITGWRRDPAR